MTDEPITIGELGGYTNNSPNKEGLKKLVKKVNEGGSSGPTYTAGDNIEISAENVISATDTTYTAGDNVQISEQNVISATDTKYTAGSGIAISDQNVISATGGGSGGTWTKRTGTDDWSDLFEIVDSTNIKTLKEMILDCLDTSRHVFFNVHLDKGVIFDGRISLGAGAPYYNSNKLVTQCVYIKAETNVITGSYIYTHTVSNTFTTDGQSVTITTGSSDSRDYYKASIRIYVKE